MRAAREALGLTQAQFALLLGRRLGHGYAPDWTHVQRWEAGGRRPGRVWGVPYYDIVTAVEHAQRARQGQAEQPANTEGH